MSSFEEKIDLEGVVTRCTTYGSDKSTVFYLERSPTIDLKYQNKSYKVDIPIPLIDGNYVLFTATVNKSVDGRPITGPATVTNLRIFDTKGGKILHCYESGSHMILDSDE